MKFNYDMSICPGGEDFFRRNERRRHLPKIGHFCGKTARPSDRQTLWFLGKLHFQTYLSRERMR